jgi:hypothetical protein
LSQIVPVHASIPLLEIHFNIILPPAFKNEMKILDVLVRFGGSLNCSWLNKRSSMKNGKEAVFSVA